MSTPEAELLRDYATANSQEAFSSLVARYVDLVYSAALRQVRSPQLAEEITQNTFVALAQNAHRLKPNAPLVAWLFLVTRRAAIDAIRAESRRQTREKIAMDMIATNSTSADWSKIAPQLDEAIAALSDRERHVILLRFFEEKSFREVGDILGTSEDTAQKRVSRALDQLRNLLSRRGVSVGAASLAVSLSAHAVQTAPIGLGLSISTSAVVASAVVAQGTMTGGATIFAMTTIQKVIVGAAIIATVGVGVREYQVVQQQRQQLAAADRESDRLKAEVRQLRRERDAATERWASLQSEIESASARVAQTALAAKASDSPGDMKAVLDRAADLQRRVAESPSAWARGSGLLKKEDWLTIALKHPLDTDKDVKNALNQIQHDVVGKWSEMVNAAVLGFAKASGGILPTDSSQLATFLPAGTDPAILQRFELLRTGNINDLPRETFLIANIGSLDDESGSVVLWGQGNMTLGSDESGDKRETLRAYLGFVRDHNGQTPTDVGQLQPYFRRAVDPQRVEEFWRSTAHFLR